MIASRPNSIAVLLLVGAGAFALACRTPAPDPLVRPIDSRSPNSPVRSLLDPLITSPARPPSDADLAAASLAAAALASRPRSDVAGAMERLRAAGPEGAKLLEFADDVVHSASDDPITYREAAEQLAARSGLNPAHQKRLERAVADDPLRLASRRIWDSRMTVFARTFNAVSVPLGNSLLTGALAAPLTIGSSVVHWMATMFERDPISLQGRQALVHWKTFIARHPDAPEGSKLTRKIEGAEARLAKTRRNHLLRDAKRALAGGEPRKARALTESILQIVPDDDSSRDLLDVAKSAVEERERLERRSLGAVLEAELVEDERLLAEALWLPDGGFAELARTLRDADPEGALADEAEFILALAQYELGFESESWQRIDLVARRSPQNSNMARHAAALITNPWQNAYGSFRDRKLSRIGREALWRTLGPWSRGPRYQALPSSIAYLIDVPAITRTVIMSPLRLIFSSWRGGPDFLRPAALSAYDYLGRQPHGEHARELIEWLYDYEKDRENWPSALRLADFQPDLDSAERLRLLEQAAEVHFAAAQRAPRRDMRRSMLRNLVLEYPDSGAGQAAGVRARSEILNASAQQIRLTRGFLLENPRILGSAGIGLNRALWDGAYENEELHPEGVTFLGGRLLEFSLVAESGDEDEPPLRLRRQVSAERLSRIVSLVDQNSRHNAVIDRDDGLGADADRDHFFERARLGATERPDSRPAAESTYVYRGVRERYGMVRGRESILPFDLVLRGSLGDLSLGAFPRWREPRLTPDSILYH